MSGDRATPMDGRAGWRPGPALALVAILAVTVVLRVRLLDVPLERDEGEYAYMGQLILRGEVPYVAAHNMKLPGTYCAYAAIMAVFGQTTAAIRAGLLLINLGAILLVHRLGRTLVDETAGLVAAAAYAVWSLDPAVLGFTANTEHFVVLPMLAGGLLLTRPAPTSLARVALAGLLLGIAFVMKQPGGAFVAFGVCAVCVRARVWRRAALEAIMLVAAAALPYALTCAIMLVVGAAGPFWFWTVTYAREYVTMIPLADGLAALRAEGGHVIGSATALWLLATLGLTAPAWDAPARRAAVFLGLLTVWGMVAVCPGLRFTVHYFILLLPALALWAGAAVSALARRAGERRTIVATVVTVAAVALTLGQQRDVLLAPSTTAVARRVYGSNPFPEAVEIAHYMRAHSTPDDRIAVIGSEPEIYFYAQRRAATSYIYMYPLMEPHPFAHRMQEEMIAQLERDPPRFLVLVNVDTSWSRRPDSSPALMAWAERTVNTSYEPVGLADILPDGRTVYRWDADARAASPQSRFYVVVFARRS